MRALLALVAVLGATVAHAPPADAPALGALHAAATEPASAASSPQGNVDLVTSPDAGRIRVAGWAFDPDAPQTPVAVHVYVGAPGEPGTEGHDLGPADGHRPDVGAVVPGVGDAHGFDVELTTGRSGVQAVHVYAINLGGTAGANVLIGTRSVTVADASPQGSVDSVDSPEAARVRVRGWAFDRNVLGRAIGVRVSVGGPDGTAGAERQDVGVADGARPDVERAFPGVGDRHGFDLTFTTSKVGAQDIYLYAVNAPGTPGRDVLLGTRRVTVQVPAQRFTPMTPARILDTRPSGPRVGPYATPWGAGTSRDVTVTGVGGVPADAEAVVLNVTATGTTTGSHLTLWPAGEPRPTASNLNWQPGWTVANAVTVKVGRVGEVSVANGQGAVDVVLDVVGYYRRDVGAGYTPLAPRRVLDSRRDGPAVGAHRTPWAPGTTRQVRLGGVGGVPADAVAVVVNATATNTTAGSFLTVWPAGRDRPLASSLNWQPGWSIANAVTVELGDDGAVDIYNNLGHTDVVLDVVGYFRQGAGRAFHPVSPYRIQDSRPGGRVGPHVTPWTGGAAREVVVTSGRVPSYASAVVLNVTATNTTAGSHLTVWPAGAARPLASSLNWQAGWTVPNAVVAPVGLGGRVSVFNNAGAVDVVADLGGWYG